MRWPSRISRRAMLAPMRPSPTIPRSMSQPYGSQPTTDHPRTGVSELYRHMRWKSSDTPQGEIACGPMASNGNRAAEAADVLTIFGITGDLAKKMTFRALYRLEAARQARVPDRRRRDRRVVDRAAARARPRGDRGHGRRPRRGRLRPARRPLLLRPGRLRRRRRPSSGSPRRSATRSGRSSTSRSRPRCSPPWSTDSATPGSPRTPTS